MKKFEQRLSTLLKTTKDWNSLKLLLEKETYQSGKLFEVFCKCYFKHEPIVKDDYKNVWYYEEIPTEIKAALGLPNSDYGIDLLLQTIDGEFIAVQCKFRSNENTKLNWSADKITNLIASADKADWVMVFTNATDIDSVSKSKDNFILFGISYLLNIEENTFNIFRNFLEGEALPTITKHLPKPHQIKAIESCEEFFKIENRGQLIMPCGAGKTITALWIKERLNPKNTLVLVPSLALLRQIKEDWAKQKIDFYHYLCVCSETDIDKNNDNESDSIIAHTYEIGGRVQTKPEVIIDFLRKDFEKIIFSTYQSLPQIEKALQDTDFQFDFILCDEAHKTAGTSSGIFTIVHDNKRIPALKRLYMTATPRVLSDNIKKKLGDNLAYAYDMSNPADFGYEFYRMSFKDAIDKGILVDYKIITIGISHKQIAELIKERRYISDKNTIEDIANNYALEIVMKQYNATHAITFHSRVKYAEEFSMRHKLLFENVKTMSVNGNQSTNARNILMTDFKNASKAVISNARCLTEGVDVPAIDLVYFCDPKNSKVDIVQATGRALRQDKRKDKKMGYIVIPIYHQNQDEVDKAISNSNFKNLISVIRALCDQDERLQDEINQLAYGKGKKSSFSKLEFVSSEIYFEEKVHLLGFEEKLKNNLFNQVIEKNSDNWDLWFLQLKDYLELNNNEYPSKKSSPKLYGWITAQRNFYKNKQLSYEQVKKLKAINFVWDAHSHSWDIQFKILEEHAQEKGFEPNKSTDIGIWLTTQRTAIKKGILSNERIQKINSVKFKGTVIDAEWHKRFDDLVEYRNKNSYKWPNADRVNKDKPENKIANFCQQMRFFYRKNTLSDFWIDKLLSIDFNFDGRNDNWLKTYETLKEYLNKNGMLPEASSDLYNWAWRNNNKYINDKLDKNKKKLLADIDIDRLFKSKSWDEWYNDIKAFYDLSGSLPTFNTDKQLGAWLGVQRGSYKKGELDDVQIKKLEELGIIWDGNEAKKDRWIEMFDAVNSFYQENGRFPTGRNKGEEQQLYNWCQGQRQKQAGTASGGKTKELKDWQVKKLENIEFDFQPRGEQGLEEIWEKNYEELKEFCNKSKLTSLPSVINGNSSKLYRWLKNQEIDYEKGRLKKERELKLAELGIDFEDKKTTKLKGNRYSRLSWEQQYNQLKLFVEQNNGLIPRVRISKEEDKLYNFYYNNRKKYKSGELELDKVELLKVLNIIS